MPIIKKLLLSFSTIAALLSSIVAQSGVSGPPLLSEQPSLSELTAHADLVFQGTLKNIRYKDSVDKMPHTFVTYKVDKVFKGVYGAPDITLRFIGGIADGGKSDMRLIVSHGSHFGEAGVEQGIMMIRGNAEAESVTPFVGGDKSRFLVDGPYVTTPAGSTLAMDVTGQLTHIAPYEYRDGQDGYYGGKTDLSDLNKVHKAPMNRDSFVKHLRSLIHKQGLKGAGNERPVISADINVPFMGLTALAEKGPADPDEKKSKLQRRVGQVIRQDTAFERWEKQQLRLNGGNPVLTNNQYDGAHGIPGPQGPPTGMGGAAP